jgi:hypothetical protein
MKRCQLAVGSDVVEITLVTAKNEASSEVVDFSRLITILHVFSRVFHPFFQS